MSETNPTNTSTSIIVDGVDITQPHAEWVGKCTPTPKKKHATFWRGFHIAIDKRNEAGKLYAVCNVCGYVLISHNSGTTNLRRHMKAVHPVVFDRLQEIQESEQGVEETAHKKRSASSGAGSPARQKKPKKAKKKAAMPIEAAEMAQAMYCIAANRPFSDLDQPAMRVFAEACGNVGRAGGRFVPSAVVARSNASEAVEKAQVTIKEKLQEAKDVVLSIDFWENQSNQNSAYVSVRWIKGFKLYHCFLDIVKYVGAASVDEIMTTVTEDLKKFEIHDRITYLVSNVDLSGNEFCTKHDIAFIGCFDFDLQSVIDSSLSPAFGATDVEGETTSNEFGRVMHKARKSAMKSASVVVSDSVSRWWSCFAMIESLLAHRALVDANNSKGDDSEDNALEDGDWEKLKLMKDTLAPFVTAIKMLTGNTNCTASLVPFILFVAHSEFSRLVKAVGTSSNLVAKILKSFEAKFGKGVTVASGDPKTSPGLHKHFLLAHALDPRFKQLKVLADDEDKEKLWKIILEEMVALDSSSKPHQTKKKSPEAAGDAAAASILRGVAQKEEGKREETKDSIFDQYAGVLESGPVKDENAWKIDCMNELKLYRSDSTVGMRTENGKEDPLSWWKSHRVAFPTLWKLAKVYLAIPATSAGPRMAFSVQESAIASRRYTLSDDLPQDSDFLYQNSWIFEE